jgi:protein-disulfide isomerase
MRLSLRTIGKRGMSAAAAGAVLLVLGSQAEAVAKKGPKISVADDPSLKNGSPVVVLVEVSDYQCPYCGHGAREVLPQIYDAFVHPGKVELIYLDLALEMHPQAFKAAEAAACAGDQDMFWDMHHKLFVAQTEKNGLALERFAGYAEELGLDVAAFQKCLAGGRHAPGIRSDMRVAQTLGIVGTPAYLIGRRLPGDKVEVLEVIKGLPTYEALAEKLNTILSWK